MIMIPLLPLSHHGHDRRRATLKPKLRKLAQTPQTRSTKLPAMSKLRHRKPSTFPSFYEQRASVTRATRLSRTALLLTIIARALFFFEQG